MPKKRTKKRGNKEGTIRQRKDGLWEARITTAVTVDGKPKQRSFYGKTREEAAAKLNDALHKQTRGLLTEPSAISIEEYFESWLNGKRHIADKTRATYAHALGHVSSIIGGERLQKLSPIQIRHLYTALADKGLSPRTQRYSAMLLKSALKEAVALQLIARNPAEALKVKMPRVEKKAEAWNRDEAAAFMRAARGELVRERIGGAKAKGKQGAVVEASDPKPIQHYPIFYLMLALGLRRGEALGLRWRDIDFEEGVLSVRQALTVSANGKILIKEVKTPASRRSLYLPPDVLAVLREHQEKMTRLFGKLELVFVSEAGTPIAPRNLSRGFNEACAVAGVRRIRIQDLRHTYASLALQRGVPVEVVSERLGHASVGFTLDTYRHLYEVERREAALSLDDLFGGKARALN